MVRFITSHTVLAGRPSPQRVTWRLVNSYSIGPFVPSETFRRYQKQSCRLLANVSTAMGSFARGGHHPFRPPLPLIGIRLGLHHRALEPTAGIGGNRDEIDGADRFFDGLKKFRAMAIQTIGDDILERQHPLVAELPQHRHR